MLPIHCFKELVIQFRAARATHASHFRPPAPQLTNINDKWILRFQRRHPKIGGICARPLEYVRKDGATYEHVKGWLAAVDTMLREHEYDPADMRNMEESGFGIGEEQAMKRLVHLDSTQKYKVIGSKQEWVIVIECISAADEVLALLLIFRDQDVNTRWIEEQSPNGWHFATSKNS